MSTVQVAVDNATFHFDKLYTYRLPARLEGKVFEGSMVLVPFGRGDKPRMAVVLALGGEEPEESLPAESLALAAAQTAPPPRRAPRLKEVFDAAPEEARLTPDLLKLVHFLKERTFCTFYEAVRAIIGHYFRFLRDNPTFVKMVLWENLNEATYFRQSQAQFIKGTVLELLREKLKQGVREGIFFAGLDVDETVLSVNMFCFSYFSNQYTMAQIMKVDFQDPMVFQKRCDHVTDLLMTYLLQEKGTISQ